MSRHILQLDVPDTTNPGIFLLRDTSIYSSTIPVSCPELQILPSGYNIPSVIGVSAGFNLVFNACSLGMLSVANCSDSCPELPEGIWNIRYSVAPSDKVWVSYNYLRAVKAFNRLNGLLCDLSLDCALPSQELETDIENIAIIREYLIAAKTLVEMQNKPEDGLNLYRFAVSLMDKMTYKRAKC